MCQAQVQVKLESDLVALGFVKFSLDNRWTVLVEAKVNFYGLAGWVAGLLKNKAFSASNLFEVWVKVEAELGNNGKLHKFYLPVSKILLNLILLKVFI